MAWMQYNLKYSWQHRPIKPADVRECINAGLQHNQVTTEVHAVRTHNTKNKKKGFRTKFDIWLAPKEEIAEDEYLVPRFLMLDEAVHDMVQTKGWRDACNNEHATKLKVAFLANNSTVDTPEFMVTGFAADTHGTACRQLKHIAVALYRGVNNGIHPSYRFDDLLDWLREVGARWGFFIPSNGEMIRVLMFTFKKRSLAGELLHQTYKDKNHPGVDILGTRHKLIPFPPREDKATKQKVGNVLKESQRALKSLREVRIPKVRFMLSAVEEMTLVENLPHCVCMSTHLVGEELRYSVMVAPDPKSAAYTTENVQESIKQAFLEMVDNTWIDPTATNASEDNDAEEAWDGKAEVPADLQRLAWASCEPREAKHSGNAAPTHHWAHIKLPSTKQ